MKILKRVEPLLRIAEQYVWLGDQNEKKVKEMNIKNSLEYNSNQLSVNYVGCSYYDLAYNYVKMGLELEYPEKCVLFVNRQAYDFERWFLLSKVILKDNAFTMYVNNNRFDRTGFLYKRLVEKYKEGFESVKLCLSVVDKNPINSNENDIKICIENLKIYTSILDGFNKENERIKEIDLKTNKIINKRITRKIREIKDSLNKLNVMIKEDDKVNFNSDKEKLSNFILNNLNQETFRPDEYTLQNNILQINFWLTKYSLPEIDKEN